MKRAKATAGTVDEALETAAPDGWAIPMDREHPVRDALAACERYGIDLSGSQWEKMSRAARRLDVAAYRAGGGAEGDRLKLQSHRADLARLVARRAGLVSGGRQSGEADAAIVFLEGNIEVVQRRIAAAGGEEDQAIRADRLNGIRRRLDGAASQAARIQATPGAQVPPELEDELDALTLQLDDAEAAFDAGGLELSELAAALREAEVQARNGLATVLRMRVLAAVAATVREAMAGRVALHLRRPEKPLPPEVESALFEAASICATADKLDGEPYGLVPLAAALSEDLRRVLFPGESFPREMAAWRRVAKRAEAPGGPAEGVLSAVL